MNARVGDSVLVRGKVISTHGGYPVVTFFDGSATAAVDKFDIVSVEQAFRVGDWAQDKTGSDYGEIVAIAEGQAWIKQVGMTRLVTRDLRSVTRMDKK